MSCTVGRWRGSQAELILALAVDPLPRIKCHGLLAPLLVRASNIFCMQGCPYPRRLPTLATEEEAVT